jgi:hypothetical protein
LRFAALAAKPGEKSGLVRWNEVLGSNDLVEAIDRLVYKFRGERGDSFANSKNGKSSNLADLEPGAFGKSGFRDLKVEGKSGSLSLARDGHSDHRSRSFVEHVMADDENRPATRFFLPSYGGEIGPINLSP